MSGHEHVLSRLLNNAIAENGFKLQDYMPVKIGNGEDYVNVMNERLHNAHYDHLNSLTKFFKQRQCNCPTKRLYDGTIIKNCSC